MIHFALRFESPLGPIILVSNGSAIIGQNGALTGFAGGLERKQKLLQLESAAPDHGMSACLAGRERYTKWRK
jgi:hypothetical protein